MDFNYINWVILLTTHIPRIFIIALSVNQFRVFGNILRKLILCDVKKSILVYEETKKKIL